MYTNYIASILPTAGSSSISAVFIPFGSAAIFATDILSTSADNHYAETGLLSGDGTCFSSVSTRLSTNFYTCLFTGSACLPTFACTSLHTGFSTRL